MLKQRKIPMRMCVACHEARPKKELVRIVKGPDGTLTVDTTGKAQGRGAYLCADVACLEKAYKTKALDRALEAQMTEETFAQCKRVILRREIGK